MKTNNILSVLMAFLMLSSIASAVEIRGTVVEANDSLVSGAETYTWNAQNFAGFYYDLDTGEHFETLKINEISANRTIPDGKLVYETSPINTEFNYFKERGQLVDGHSTYSLVGWQAEKWVALNGDPSKLVKLLIEEKETEKRSLQSGGTLTLGKGYALKINSVDAKAAPRQAWISLLKDGIVIDDEVVQQNSTYVYKKDISGTKDVVVLFAYISSIFSGSEAEMIQFQYLWMIDESTLTKISASDTFGVFKVTTTSPTLKLTSDNDITLSKDSVITLMGNMKFKVADSDVSRFYPFVDIKEIDVSAVAPVIVVTSIPTPVLTTPTPVVVVETQAPAPITPEPVVTIAPKETVVPIPVVTTAKPTPGFETIFAIVGLIAIAFIVLKQKRKD